MSEVMQAKLVEVLGEMAVKLGTTAEHLYGVLVAQAAVSAWVALVGLALMFLVSIPSLVIGIRLLFSSKPTTDLQDAVSVVALVIGGVLFFLGTLGLAVNLETIVTGFVNPEYLAIKNILDAIGGK